MHLPVMEYSQLNKITTRMHSKSVKNCLKSKPKSIYSQEYLNVKSYFYFSRV